MTSEPYALIVSTVADIATDAVIEELTRARVPHLRLNTEDFPFARALTLRRGSHADCFLEIDGRPLATPAVIWYRRIRVPATLDDMDAGVYEYCVQESRSALLGALLSFPGPWFNHPARVWEAEHKAYQLAVAHRLGLNIPQTLITNSAREIREFCQRVGDVVVKPTRSGHLRVGDEERAVFTTRLGANDLATLDGDDLTTSTYQALIQKRADIRVTIIGDRLFCAEIDSQSDPQAQIDWRATSNPRLPHSPHRIPRHLANQLLQLMSALQLQFGALDLIHTAADEYVFLEVNPSGQWLWLDDFLDLGISREIARWLGRATSAAIEPHELA